MLPRRPEGVREVAVDAATGRVFIAGRDGNQLELIDLGTHGTPTPHQG